MYVTVPERRRRAIDRIREASVAAMAALSAYAEEHDGRFLVFGSIARGDIAPSSDFDVLVDFPGPREREARDFVEEACRRLGLVPDAHLLSEAPEKLVARARRDRAPVTSAQWLDVDEDIEDAATHFLNAKALFEIGSFDKPGLEGYRDRMALMHALQAAHISAERALQRILRILGEEQPVGEDWHQKLIARLAKPIVGEHARPPLLSDEVATDLDETRRFRHIAMRSYGIFEAGKAGPSIDAAARLATTPAADVARFRDAIDGNDP